MVVPKYVAYVLYCDNYKILVFNWTCLFMDLGLYKSSDDHAIQYL